MLLFFAVVLVAFINWTLVRLHIIAGSSLPLSVGCATDVLCNGHLSRFSCNFVLIAKASCSVIGAARFITLHLLVCHVFYFNCLVHPEEA